MKKRMLLALALIICLAVMSACSKNSGGTNYAVINTSTSQPTQNLNLSGAQTATEEPVVDFDDGSYDPATEENNDLPDWMIDEGEEQEAEPIADSVTAVPTIRSEYAGATPVVIDPIDKPTATPVPSLTFSSYQVYDATKLGLSFEAPVGWVTDDSVANTFILTNPDPSVDYAASITVQTISVGSSMSKSDLVTQIKSMLTSIGQGMASFSPSNTAERTLLDNDGVYANYTGTLSDGTEVAGRIHITCLEKVLYVVHVSYPRAYTDAYKDGVYDQVRHTIKITK